MKHTFLHLGKQPIANKFLTNLDETKDEYFYPLDIQFEDETCLVSQKHIVPAFKMFNDSYIYHSSASSVVAEHFAFTAELLSKIIGNNAKVLEIGSNDNVFSRHFPKENSTCVEPCGNFAKITNDMGYKTYGEFWTDELAQKIVEERGKFDLVFSANCMCHIHDIYGAFKAVESVLNDEGLFVFEDPDMYKTIKNCAYDQFYDEHAHIFSLIALNNILPKCGMKIVRVERISPNGGSYRVYATKNSSSHPVDNIVEIVLGIEKAAKLDQLETYFMFADAVEKSKKDLIYLLHKLRKTEDIIGYGATSKLTTITNYCGIKNNLISYIIDAMPSKQGKFLPGSHIPVVKFKPDWYNNIKHAFLGAWNMSSYIIKKESAFLNGGGHFITHVPEVRII